MAILGSIQAIGNAVSAVFSFFGKAMDWLHDRTMRKLGRKEQALDDAQKINELHNEANKIDIAPPMSPDEQLDWMRNRTKHN